MSEGSTNGPAIQHPPPGASAVRALTTCNLLLTIAAVLSGVVLPIGPVIWVWSVATPFIALSALILNRSTKVHRANLANILLLGFWVVGMALLLQSIYARGPA